MCQNKIQTDKSTIMSQGCVEKVCLQSSGNGENFPIFPQNGVGGTNSISNEENKNNFKANKVANKNGCYLPPAGSKASGSDKMQGKSFYDAFTHFLSAGPASGEIESEKDDEGLAVSVSQNIVDKPARTTSCRSNTSRRNKSAPSSANITRSTRSVQETGRNKMSTKDFCATSNPDMHHSDIVNQRNSPSENESKFTCDAKANVEDMDISAEVSTLGDTYSSAIKQTLNVTNDVAMTVYDSFVASRTKTRSMKKTRLRESTCKSTELIFKCESFGVEKPSESLIKKQKSSSIVSISDDEQQTDDTSSKCAISCSDEHKSNHFVHETHKNRVENETVPCKTADPILSASVNSTKIISDIEVPVAEDCIDIKKTIKPKRFSSRRIPRSIEYEDFAEENTEQDSNSKCQKEQSKVSNEKDIMKRKEASNVEDKNIKTQKKENGKNRFELITQREITEAGFQFSEESEKKEKKVEEIKKDEVELKKEEKDQRESKKEEISEAKKEENDSRNEVRDGITFDKHKEIKELIDLKEKEAATG